MNPEWLPPPLSLSGSSLEADYESLFSVYERDFVDGSLPTVDGSQVVTNPYIDPFMGGIYPYGFTHLVTKGKDDRTIDYNRAKKLPWVRAVIENYQEPEVTAFYVDKTPDITLYLWLVDHDFVVILRRPKSRRERELNNKIIITAYHVDSYGQSDLQRLYGRSFKQL